MTNMVDIITKIIGKQKIATISPADLGIVMAGGLSGYLIDSIARGVRQIPPNLIDVVGILLGGAGAFYLKQPWNTLSAGVATGITIGALRMPIDNTARQFVARANGVPVETTAKKAGVGIHIGASNLQDRSPNSPYVGMIQPNVFYQSGVAGYTFDMANRGLSTSYAVKAPFGNGPRYTV